MVGKFLIPVALVCSMALSACSEQERREIRQKEIAIAAEQARQQRILEQHVANLNAETQRQEQVHAAETQRQLHEKLTLLARFAAAIGAIGGVVAWVVYSLRRLGERVSQERTKRQSQLLDAIKNDPLLPPEHRGELYSRAIEAASKGSGPLLIGYSNNNGGPS